MDQERGLADVLLWRFLGTTGSRLMLKPRTWNGSQRRCAVQDRTSRDQAVRSKLAGHRPAAPPMVRLLAASRTHTVGDNLPFTTGSFQASHLFRVACRALCIGPRTPVHARTPSQRRTVVPTIRLSVAKPTEAVRCHNATPDLRRAESVMLTTHSHFPGRRSLLFRSAHERIPR